MGVPARDQIVSQIGSSRGSHMSPKGAPNGPPMCLQWGSQGNPDGAPMGFQWQPEGNPNAPPKIPHLASLGNPLGIPVRIPARDTPTSIPRGLGWVQIETPSVALRGSSGAPKTSSKKF